MWALSRRNRALAGFKAAVWTGYLYRALMAPQVVGGWGGTEATSTKVMRAARVVCGIYGPPSTEISV
jgi:hypothetical protein